MTTANIITLVRIAMIPVFLIFGTMGQEYALVSAIIFTVASLTDSLDGYIARKYNQITDFGKLVDPLADKLLVLSALLIFVQNGIMPVWVATVIIGREFAISGLRMIAATKGIVIAAGKSGKVKTFVQCLMTILLLVLGTNIVSLTSWLTLQDLAVYLMVIVAVYSGVEYFIVNGKIFKGSLK
jgi:CDP-diacylglycerol--glycerol-3-phosphate 3-phosphatidyltransferase